MSALVAISFLAAISPGRAEPPSSEEEDDDDDVEVLVVTGTRTPRRLGESPVAVEVVDREAIRDSGAEDLGDLLDQQPGVNVQRGVLGSTVRLRGLNPEHVLILVDGQRVVGRKDGTFDFSRIPVDGVERIEIVKGASSALYGSEAMGGVIQIITKQDGKPSTSFTAHGRGGTGATVDTTAGFTHRNKRATYKLDAGWHGNRPQDLDPSTEATNVRGVRQASLSGSARFTPNERWDLRLSGRYSLQDSRGVDQGLGAAVFDARNVIEDAGAQLTGTLSFDKRTSWTNTVGTSIFRDQFVNDQRNSGALDAYTETRETLVQLTSQVVATRGAHELTGGVEGYLSMLTSERLAEGRGTRLTGGAFVQDIWTIGRSNQLALVPGVRADGDSWFGGTVAPKLAVRFDPHDTLTIRLNGGFGWRAPGFRELLLSFDNAGVGYRVQGNPDLVPESSRSVTLGMEWAPSSTLSVSASGWFDSVQNLIQIATIEEVPGFSLFGYRNIARARTRGIEAGAGVRPNEWLGVDVSFTWTDAIDVDTRMPLEGRPALQGSAALKFRVPVRHGPRLTARAGLFGPRPFYGASIGVSGQRVDAPAYALIDARIAQPIGKRLALFAGIENATNAGDPRFLPVPPRFIYLGADIDVSIER